MHASVSRHVCAGQGITYKSWFSPFTMQVLGLNSDHQAWQQLSLHAEPSQPPLCTDFDSSLQHGK